MAKKTILRGYELCENGEVRADYFEESRFRRAFSPPPVVWNGEPASLYYWNYSRTSTPINQNASDLIIDTGITIHGPAFIVTGSEWWHHFRAEGSFEEVQDRLSNVIDGLFGKIAFPPSPPWELRQDIYIENDDDAFAVKMAL